jgi:hypothetical protein
VIVTAVAGLALTHASPSYFSSLTFTLIPILIPVLDLVHVLDLISVVDSSQSPKRIAQNSARELGPVGILLDRPPPIHSSTMARGPSKGRKGCSA